MFSFKHVVMLISSLTILAMGERRLPPKSPTIGSFVCLSVMVEPTYPG